MDQSSNTITAQKISLPDGGGSLKSLGETFKASAFTGTGNFNIPIPLTHARGLEPQLSLSYNSGTGNGIFGLGCSINLSKISIRTEKGLPQFNGDDIFMLDGEVLTPKSESQRQENGYLISQYLPRVESAFSQIEYYLKADKSSAYWKVTTANNITSVYGLNRAARIFDKENPAHIFEWLIESTVDSKENKILYHYVQEDNAGIGDQGYEAGRALTNKYIQNIQYGNFLDASGKEQYAFEAIFDYGQYDLSNLTQGGHDPYSPSKTWSYRPDPFSSYKSTFEIRTRRLCQNILLFHHFKAELGKPCLVKTLNLNYSLSNNSNISLLQSVIETGYKRAGTAAESPYDIQSMPPLEFKFSEFNLPDAPVYKELAIDGVSIPGYLNTSGFQPVDLKGEGISGLFYSNAESLLYCEPEGNGHYGLPTTLTHFPVDQNFQNAQATLVDLEGNGQLELVVKNTNRTGFYQRGSHLESKEPSPIWQQYQAFEQYPTDYASTDMEMAGLSNNGKTDLLLVNQEALHIYPSSGKQGYGCENRVTKAQGFPSIKKNYPKEHVGFTNLFGDGLPHRVKITKNSVECWPSLGFGKYGDKISLESAPDFGDDFDAKRLFLADIDGSGTTDLIYVQATQVSLYINQSGNAFSDAITIPLPEQCQYSAIDQIQFSDVLGNGTSCLVYTKMLPTPKHYFYNFVGDSMVDGKSKSTIKPYLLSEIDNNMGAVSIIEYCSSTHFYLEDKKAGTPWRTQLPFPVQLVAKTINIDQITGLKTATCFAYHDGYYDHEEKEFYGFGFVETWDSETYDEFQQQSSAQRQGLEKKYYTPPVYTKTWYANGAAQQIYAYKNSDNKLGAFFKGDKDAYDFPAARMNVVTDDYKTLNQAYAALKGTVIRAEVYADDPLDNPELYQMPYTVEEHCQEVSLYQKRNDQEYAVFMVTPRESISYHYERNPKDPRVQQHFTLATDTFGNPLVSCDISLARRNSADPDVTSYPEQTSLKAIVSLQKYVTPVQDTLYCHLSCEQQQLELLNLELTGQYCGFSELYNKVKELNLQQQNNIMPYSAPVSGDRLQARQLTWERTYFWNEDLTLSLPLGETCAISLIHHHEKAVFSQEFIDDVFANRLTEDILTSQAGYVFEQKSNYWWNKGLVQFYDQHKFYQPSKTENAFVEPSSNLYALETLSYDDYALFVTETQQYIDTTNSLITKAVYDYRCAQLCQLTDPNNNITQALFDPLGQVIVTSLIGTENGVNSGGMTLYSQGATEAEYQQKAAPAFEQVIHSPKDYLQGACSYFYYNLHAWAQSKQPASSIHLVRNSFYCSSQKHNAPYCQIEVSYSDGFGHILATKRKADPGLAFIREATGKLKTENNQVQQLPTSRWQVSGRTVYNNKGQAVEQYLPYFINTPEYEDQQDIPCPPPTKIYYDPLGRVIKTVSPKGFFSKVEFSPWVEQHFDENDTLLDSDYYKNFKANYPDEPTEQQQDEMDALDKATAFYNTPELKVLDNLGFVIRDIQYKTQQEQLVSYEANDIQGRTITSIDPRLYQSNTTSKTDYYNFKYRYPMGQKDPIYIDSTDAGVERHLSNIYGKQLISLSARNYCQLINYDRLQRQTELKVKKLSGVKIIDAFTDFNLVEQFFYEDYLLAQGKTQKQLQDCNLWGALYQLNDLSGTVTHHQYSLHGEVLQTSRQIVEDYKKAVDWRQEVALENDVYKSQFTYNAVKQLITETTPDDLVTTKSYNQLGLLKSVALTLSDGTYQQIIKKIDYDANGQRTELHYGNGIKTCFQYEATTLHLLSIQNSQQDLQYTYDPVGNITRLRDQTYQTVFHSNQKVSPLSDYSYDALYRLTAANGRQHPGVNASSLKQADFIALPSINDGNALESYSETYSYDDSGNLIKKQHQASSSSWTTETPVEANCNHLQGLKYDASGNLRQASTGSNLGLSFNCCENLVKATIVQRQNGPDDSEYYLYDSHEQRTRKVSELMVKNGTLGHIEDKIYLGNYELKRNKTLAADKQLNISLQRQTLRVMDGYTCIAIIHSWDIDKNQKETQNLNIRKIRYQLDNHLGSVALELDQQAQLISYEEYFPYGGTALQAGKNLIEVALKTYRYSGKERDNSTGFYYYGRRYYAPGLGRWLNPDPAHRVDGMNLYAFVGGNPVGHVDVDGLFKNSFSKILSFFNKCKFCKNKNKDPSPSISSKSVDKKKEKRKKIDEKNKLIAMKRKIDKENGRLETNKRKLNISETQLKNRANNEKVNNGKIVAQINKSKIEIAKYNDPTKLENDWVNNKEIELNNVTKNSLNEYNTNKAKFENLEYVHDANPVVKGIFGFSNSDDIKQIQTEAGTSGHMRTFINGANSQIVGFSIGISHANIRDKDDDETYIHISGKWHKVDRKKNNNFISLNDHYKKNIA